MNNISLVPPEMKRREEEAKEKARAAAAGAGFRLHMPQKPVSLPVEPLKKTPESWVKVEKTADAPKKKGFFDFLKRKKEVKKPLPPPPIVKPIAKIPAALPVVHQFKKIEAPIVKKELPPQPVKREFIPVKKEVLPPIPIKKIETPEKSMPIRHVELPKAIMNEKKPLRMRIPLEVKDRRDSNEDEKQIISEANDQIADVKRSHSLWEIFGKGKLWERLKRTPADVNLIFEDYVEVVRTQFMYRLRVLLSLVLVVFVVFLGSFTAIKFYQMILVNEYNQLNRDIEKQVVEIKNLNSDQAAITDFKARSVLAEVLLQKHLYWTQFLDTLEHNTVDNVFYTDFVANGNGQISLIAVGKSYTDLAKQLQQFQEADFVKKVSITSGSFNQASAKTDAEGAAATLVSDTVEFMVDLEINQEALFKK